MYERGLMLLCKCVTVFSMNAYGKAQNGVRVEVEACVFFFPAHFICHFICLRSRCGNQAVCMRKHLPVKILKWKWRERREIKHQGVEGVAPFEFLTSKDLPQLLMTLDLTYPQNPGSLCFHSVRTSYLWTMSDHSVHLFFHSSPLKKFKFFS